VRTARTLHALAWRQVRVSTIAMTLFAVAAVEVGVSSFSASGGAAGLAGTAALLKNPAMVALYGRATNLDTAGALVAWKLGMWLALAVALWAGLAATRLVRGAEDDGTAELVVAGPGGRRALIAAIITVLAEAGVLVGAAIALSLLGGGQARGDSLLYGACFTGLAWCGSALGLVSSELVAPRRSASQAALGALGLAYLARMVIDGSSGFHALIWLTPFGWLENAGAFQHRDAVAVVPFFVVAPILTVVAVAVARERDVGRALWTRADRSRARETWLATPWRFAWRERRATLTVWGAGMVLWGLVLGYLTNAIVAFARSDPGYVALLDKWGLGVMITARGFLAEEGAIVAVGLSFLVVTLVVMLGQDGQRGRLDVPLAVGTSRPRWYASTVVTALVGTVAVAALSALALWAGVEASGTSMGLAAPMKALLNAATPVPLVLGLTAVAVALVPRFAYVVMSLLLGVSYLVAVLGPALGWPHLVIDLSLFHYPALVPALPPNWGADVMFFALGAVATGVGVAAFTRRDLAL